MKLKLKACLLSAILAMPVAAAAESSMAPKAGEAPGPAVGMTTNCPMMQNISGMQKELGSMMGSVDGMMKDTKSSAMRKRMLAMHDQMAAMMTHMQRMSGMMGSGMMQGGTMRGGQQPTSTAPVTPAPPPVSPEDHKSHHPEQ